MLNIFLEKLMPIIIFFFLGYLLKFSKIFTKEEGGPFLKLVFYVFLPSITLLSIVNMDFNLKLASYPLIGAALHIPNYIIGKKLSEKLNLDSNSSKIFRGGFMIINMSFVLPFFLSFYKPEDLGTYFLFDTGNLVMITTVVYCIFISEKDSSFLTRSRVIFKSPTIIALCIAIIIKVLNLKIPTPIEFVLKDITKIAGPIMMISLGIFFSPKLKNLKLCLIMIGLRALSVLIFGTLLGRLFGVDQLMREVLLLAAFSPMGNNVLTYTYLSDGDIDFAATAVSLSIIFSFIALSLYLTMK